MKCEYCHKEIPPGTEVTVNNHYFCNSLHRYYWENGQAYDSSQSKLNSNTNSTQQNSSGDSNEPSIHPGRMFDVQKSMTLGDIFSTSFELIKKTFTRNIIISIVFLIPAGILFAYGIESFFSTISALTKHSINSADDFDIDQLTLVFKGMGLYFLAISAFWLGYQAAVIGIIKIGCTTINGERISINQAFKKIFSVTYFQSLGQILLIVLIFAAFILAVIIIAALMNIGNFILLKFIGVLLIIAAVVFLIYLIFRWYFILIALVNDDLGVIDTFSKSSFLIKGYWWRTLGIVILISIAVNFAISIITTPISFVLLWGHLAQYFKMMNGNGQALNDPKLFSGFMKSYFSFFGIIIILSNFLQLLIMPLFKIVIYYDLKIRKHDIKEPSVESSSSVNPELSFE